MKSFVAETFESKFREKNYWDRKRKYKKFQDNRLELDESNHYQRVKSNISMSKVQINF